MMDDTIISKIDSVDDGDDKKPYLTFLTGSKLGQIFEILNFEMVLGRSNDCDLCIEDGQISRRHFKLYFDGEKVELTDLNSTNGTYVNGQRVTSCILNEGDKIQISQSTIMELNFLDETKRLSEKKRYELGVRDALTGIYNKGYFMDRLNEEFNYARRKKLPLSLIMFDIDHFKALNDTYGHLAGDLVLQKMCEEVSKTVRSDDVFARYGGEEFALILRDSNAANSKELAERIRHLVEKQEITFESQTIKFTISSGIVTLDDTMEGPIDLIAQADKYLYRSKKQGRNRVSSA